MDKDKAMSGYEKIYDDGYKAGRASVVLPHPCDGELYKDCLLVEYIAKVLEEAKEVVDAYIDIIKDPKNPERIKHLADECTDVQVAATGVMHKLGYDEKERQRIMKEINESNAKRDGGKRFADTKKEVFGERKYFEIGEIVEVDGPTGKETGFILDENRNRDGYIVSIDGVSVDVPAKWVKKVEEV
ncbi:hypothetical protein [uncultured Mitsuokella sp.]|uniref:hypothetical protein n=1 Tax=uncultured Mitsuokella sp. TaxID=453120 RepID=UPI0026DDA021|nr:hypothetical protein [uncultured Mitsuokella sp.]